MAFKRIAERLSQVPELTRGAIDLASIMIGVLVMAVIGGVISASVFVVIPWAQDSAAQSNLAAVVQAQGVERGLGNQFTSKPRSLSNVDMTSVGILTDSRTCWSSFSRSDTGKTFFASSSSSTPTYVGVPWPGVAPSRYPSNCLWPLNEADGVDENIAPPLSEWTLYAGSDPNTFDSASGVATLGSGGTIRSPYIRIPTGQPFTFRAEGSFPADISGKNMLTFGVTYYTAADSARAVVNSCGYSSNGQAIPSPTPMLWTRIESSRIGGKAGTSSCADMPATAEYVRISLSAPVDYTQTGVMYKRPSMTLLHD